MFSQVLLCCQTPVLDLGLGVDFVIPLSQQQEQHQKPEEEEPSPISTRRVTGCLELIHYLVNGYPDS